MITASQSAIAVAKIDALLCKYDQLIQKALPFGSITAAVVQHSHKQVARYRRIKDQLVSGIYGEQDC